jgi:hypothetical protein
MAGEATIARDLAMGWAILRSNESQNPNPFENRVGFGIPPKVSPGRGFFKSS